jgi:hypothetical protein
LTLPAPPENLTFSDYHSDPDEDHGQRFDIWSKLFLIWTPFIKTRRS